jgi:tetratricopeptide (TPR) repeat protein
MMRFLKRALLLVALLPAFIRPILSDDVFEAAERRYREGELALAEQLYSRVKPGESQYPQALFRLGMIYSATGRPALAEESLRNSLKYRESAVVYSFLAGAQFNQKKFTEARESALRALQIDPRCAKAYTALGMIYTATNDWPAAQASYRQALQIRPEDANAWFLLGRACLHRDEFAKAREAFEKSLHLDAHQVRTYENLARTLDLMNEPAGAEKVFREGIRVNQQRKHPDAAILLAYGTFLSKLDRAPESLAQFREATRIAPKDAGAYYELANQLCRVKRWQEAAKVGETALSMGGSEYRVHYLLARAYTAMGESEQASKHAQEAAGLADQSRNR